MIEGLEGQPAVARYLAAPPNFTLVGHAENFVCGLSPLSIEDKENHLYPLYRTLRNCIHREG